MTGRRASAALLVAATGAGVSGCESTQARSARLEAAAVNRPAEKGFSITEQSREVKVGRTTVLQDELGAAVVVELRNAGSRAAARVPVAFSVLGRGGEMLFANDAPGLDASLIEAPLVAPGRRLLWVNDQVRLNEPGREVTAQAGEALAPPPDRIPAIEAAGARIKADPSGGFVAVGTVRNDSAIEQRRLVVYATATRADRLVAAGRSIVPRLAPGAHARFTAFLVGAPKGADLSIAVPPTTLR